MLTCWVEVCALVCCALLLGTAGGLQLPDHLITQTCVGHRSDSRRVGCMPRTCALQRSAAALLSVGAAVVSLPWKLWGEGAAFSQLLSLATCTKGAAAGLCALDTVHGSAVQCDIAALEFSWPVRGLSGHASYSAAGLTLSPLPLKKVTAAGGTPVIGLLRAPKFALHSLDAFSASA